MAAVNKFVLPVVKASALPAAVEAVRDDLTKWADLVASGRIDRFKETALLPEFITLLFNRVLGYRGASDGGSRRSIRATATRSTCPATG